MMFCMLGGCADMEFVDGIILYIYIIAVMDSLTNNSDTDS